MAWIQPVEFNMYYSTTINEGLPPNRLAALVQKIARDLIIPLQLVALCEATFKYIVINLLNLGIAIINKIHELFYGVIK